MKIDRCKKFEVDRYFGDDDDEPCCDICKLNIFKNPEFCLVCGDFKYDIFSVGVFGPIFAFGKLAFVVSVFLVVWYFLSQFLDWIFA